MQDLTARVGVDVSTVSRHLALLKNAGILIGRAEGTSVYYSLGCNCIGEFMNGLDNVLLARHDRDRRLFDAIRPESGERNDMLYTPARSDTPRIT